MEKKKRNFSSCQEAALEYAALGWKVILLHGIDRRGLCTCGSNVCPHPGKHPRTKHGLKDATTDPEVIRIWFNKYQNSNVGVVAGSESGFHVLDEDPRHGGDVSLSQLVKENGALPLTVRAKTGSGGHHLLFRWQKQHLPLGNRTDMRPGLDHKGANGYIVAPPSKHVSGGTYAWEVAPGEAVLANAPDWLLKLILDPKPKKKKRDPSSQDAPFSEGTRNDELMSIAGAERRCGASQDQILETLLKVNNEKCRPPLSREEVEKIAESVMRYESSTPANETYREVDGWTTVIKTDRDGSKYPVFLANFVARIDEEEHQDNGIDKKVSFVISGKLANGWTLPAARVSAEQFSGMAWVVRLWGCKAVVSPSNSSKENLRAAIQVMSSKSVKVKITFCHTGWRKIDGIGWVFLHAGGAIGPSGSVTTIQVSLSEKLQPYHLPDPPQGEKLKAAIRASLHLLEVAKEKISMPLLAFTYRAPLRECAVVDFTVFLAGATGNFKSELTALCQQHFGATFNSRNLPANWSATANSLGFQNFLSKDVIMVVEDFAPSGTSIDIQRLHQKAETFMRAQGNQNSRGRLSSDIMLRPEYPPRSSPLSSGEDIPKGQSIRARAMISELNMGDVDLGKLTTAQEHGRGGLFAEAMSAYVRFLAPQMDELKKTVPVRQRELRDLASSQDAHRRVADIVGSLAVGLEQFLKFAESCEAITAVERAVLWERGWKALREAGKAQAGHQGFEEPTARFLDLLRSALVAGRAHFVNVDGDQPSQPEMFGWRKHEQTTSSGDTVDVFRPGGDKLGWVDEGTQELLLDGGVAYAVAQRFARDQNTSIELSPNTLWKRLSEKGLLILPEKEKKNLVRRTVEGQRRSVVAISLPKFLNPGEKVGAMGPIVTNGSSNTSAFGPEAPIVPVSSTRPQVDSDGLI